MKIVILFIVILHSSYAVIYRLNVTEFNRMPSQFRLDDYDKCLNEPDGFYCAVEFSLVSDAPSDLLTMIQEYSENSDRHFNHTKPYYGICLTQSCREYIKDKALGTKDSLEGCLNESLWNEYKLKAKVFDNFQCTKSNEEMVIDGGDIAVVVLVLFIIMINIIASFYDILYVRRNVKNAHKYFINFSLSRNCSKLFNVRARSDPRQNRLRCLDALKTLTISLVIVGHSILPLVIFCQNVYFLELSHDNVVYQFIYNGTIIVQIFFVISGLLLSYNLQIASETKTLNWLEIPKRFGIRWLRLTPPYVVVLAFTSTWLRYAGSGPFWKRVVNDAVNDCRQSWWSHLIYVNNYYNNGQCMPHVWYLAADLQLHLVGLIVFVLCKGLIRRIALISLFVIGVIAPAFHTYFQDLNGTLVLTFEAVRTMFVTDPTFVNVYKPAHTNVPGFIVGLSLGFIIYYLQNSNFDIKKYKRYLLVYYATVPAALAVTLAGMAAYGDGPRLSIYIRVLFSVLLKPLFGICFAVLIFGCVFRFEDTIRGFLEARAWTVLCRISYCAYLCHEVFFRSIAGSSVMIRTNIIHLLDITLGNVFISFLTAIVLHLFVEAPFLGIIDTMRARETSHSKTSKSNLKNTNVIEANTLI
ncbi:nose resistant to fluoxetine protein 6-like [Zerene cesonia]|uniref:nose resistant to fluoxetine protein 6-like n=1 Tax=Zerene cesonia TaxID=33412 RepID=UPI0018E4EFD2|nr:nose resistant to fluoxetine protein 6-like [Zerene cesonia]